MPLGKLQMRPNEASTKDLFLIRSRRIDCAATRRDGARRPVSRVLSPLTREMTIHLGRSSPSASRDRPGWRRGNPPDRAGRLPRGRSATPTWSCSRWGLPCRRRCRRRGALLPHPFTLTAREPKRGPRVWRFAFCGTFPEVTLAGRYPAPCFRGARTFLPLSEGSASGEERSSDRLARPYKTLPQEIVKSMEGARRFRRGRRCVAPSRHRARRRNSLVANGAGRR
jgi:hypothetical protein